MNFLKNNAVLLVIAAFLGAAAIGGYYYLGRNSSDTTLTSASAIAGAPDKNLLSDLNSLQTIKFNTAIFSDPGFKELTDFYVDIPPQPVGNTNPFAPLPAH